MTVSTITKPATPRDIGLDFDEWRPGQWEAVEAVVTWYLDRDEQFLFLDAPTGVGKSLIAAAAIQLLRQMHEGRFKAVVETVSKTLQTQYAESSIPDAVVAWGKGNHQCLVLPDGGDPTDAPCVFGHKCSVRHLCTYYVERDAAQVSPTSILNTPFYLSGLSFVKLSNRLAEESTVHPDWQGDMEADELRLFSGAHLAIHDEAHLLEPAVRNHVEVSLNHEYFSEVGATLPPTNNPRIWDLWIENTLPLLTSMAEEYKREAQARAKEGLVPGPDMRLGKRAVGYEQQLRFLGARLLPTRPLIDLTSDERNVKFRPIWGAPFADGILFRHGHKHLLMSATIINAAAMARSLGIGSGNWLSYSMDSPFPPMLRRVIDMATVKVNYRTTDAQFRQVVEQMDDAIDAHLERGEKGIVHSVSYKRAKQIAQFSRHRRLIVTHPQGQRGGKEDAIQRFLNISGAAILVSPSVSVGEDFGRGENCRFQVFTKYPVPNIGDPIIKARMEDDGESLYAEADRAFVQAVGRGMRSEDDYCTNYVLDSGARWRFGYLPEWFRQSIVKR